MTAIATNIFGLLILGMALLALWMYLNSKTDE